MEKEKLEDIVFNYIKNNLTIKHFNDGAYGPGANYIQIFLTRPDGSETIKVSEDIISLDENF